LTTARKHIISLALSFIVRMDGHWQYIPYTF
jgi:hypothetical protein